MNKKTKRAKIRPMGRRAKLNKKPSIPPDKDKTTILLNKILKEQIYANYEQLGYDSLTELLERGASLILSQKIQKGNPT